MTTPLTHLLTPGRIGGLEVRNRIGMAPMGSNFAESDGHCGERIEAYYEARARGGAGLLIMGVASIAHPVGTAEPYQVGISRDEFIPGLARVARRAHRHGARIAIQLQHAGKTATRDLADGRPIWAPSPPPPLKTTMMKAFTKEEMASFVGAMGRQKPQLRVLDKGDIEQLIEWFAAAAARAQAAGFDGVELHAAHSYILAGFLSPYYNKREDEYGGSLENRARLLLETIAAVKRRVGPDFPVWVRLDGEEKRTEGGISIADAVATARLVEQGGVHAISVSAYATLTDGVAFTEAPLVHEPGALVGYAAAIKEAVGVPVMVAGRIEPEVANDGIARGTYDFLLMGRKLLADPDLPRKLIEGRAEFVRPCIYCYSCVSQIFVNKRVRCAANPQVGHEFEWPIEVAQPSRHVLVVGAGLAGLEAARVAALRGHRVTLVERSDRLGGVLFFAGLAYPPNLELLDNLVAQVRALPIEIRLSTEATPALVAELQPDAIIVATGLRRTAPAIPGAELKHVWSGDELKRLMTDDRADEIASRKLTLAQRALLKAGGILKVTDSARALQGLSKLWMPLGRRVVIVGGGLVGLELAEFLLAREREVTVLEASDKPGRELPIVLRWRFLDSVESRGRLHRQARVTSISAEAVLWTDAEGVEQRTEADSVVLALGTVPDDSVAQALASGGVPVHLAGDCREHGCIEGAMLDGHNAGRLV
ncbi:MAG: FAD-dependent oxidoreductase [Steroidobacteraceae bacterium]|nr:FAD-dependent oxidoreductase [Steroidobacteraceae bacterium]MBP7012685.1 FAD-dependent oxidoreductase [Steroidobacteraceae bacterium]